MTQQLATSPQRLPASEQACVVCLQRGAWPEVCHALPNMSCISPSCRCKVAAPALFLHLAPCPFGVSTGTTCNSLCNHLPAERLEGKLTMCCTLVRQELLELLLGDQSSSDLAADVHTLEEVGAELAAAVAGTWRSANQGDAGLGGLSQHFSQQVSKRPSASFSS